MKLWYPWLILTFPALFLLFGYLTFIFLSMLIDSTSGITFAQKSQTFFTREKVANAECAHSL